MTETIRVIWVAAPYKIHLYSSIARFFPRNIELKVVSAAMAYNGTIPFLGRFKRIWPLPRKDLLRQFIEFHPDVVFTDYPAYPSWYARLYSDLSERKVPLVTWLLGDFWTEYYALLRSQRLRDRPFVRVYLFTWATGLGLSNRVLTVCEWLKKRAEQRLPHNRISVQYQGVDPEPWLVKDGTSYDFKKPAVGILQDNNIRPKVEGLLRFVEVLKKMPKVNFYIAGGGPYTPLVNDAFSGITNAHLIGRVPYPEGVRRFYRSCDIYALPSGLDCAPTTLLEASLNSLPAVASRVGGIPELMREGETGWTVPNNRPDQWVERLTQLIEDGELASKMGARAREHVLTNFTWERQAASLAAVFREELAQAT